MYSIISLIINQIGHSLSLKMTLWKFIRSKSKAFIAYTCILDKEKFNLFKTYF